MSHSGQGKLSTVINSSHPGVVRLSKAGRDFVIKALHPAEPSIPGVAIPDGSTSKSIVKTFMTAVSIAAPADAVADTKMDIELNALPHPITVASYKISYQNAGGAATAYGTIRNAQMGQLPAGTDTAVANGAFLADAASSWRMTSYSMTGVHDASAYNNQGTVRAHQAPSSMLAYAASLVETTTSKLTCGLPIGGFQSEAAPTYDQMAQIGMFTGKLNEGFYMPLRLGTDADHWRSTADMFIPLKGFTDVAADGTPGRFMLDAGTHSPATAAANFPFHDEVLIPAFYTATAGVAGYSVHGFLSDNWGRICIKGMHVSSNIVLTIRLGLECRVNARSVWATELTTSPAADPGAILAYKAMSQQMADAFPADYNDAGRIWEWISKAAKSLAPALNLIPVVGPAINGVVGGATFLGDKIAEAVAKRKAAAAARV